MLANAHLGVLCFLVLALFLLFFSLFINPFLNSSECAGLRPDPLVSLIASGWLPERERDSCHNKALNTYSQSLGLSACISELHCLSVNEIPFHPYLQC